jgi:hypothetical protein
VVLFTARPSAILIAKICVEKNDIKYNDKLLRVSSSSRSSIDEKRNQNRENITTISNLASKRKNISSSIDKLNEETSIDDE